MAETAGWLLERWAWLQPYAAALGGTLGVLGGGYVVLRVLWAACRGCFRAGAWLAAARPHAPAVAQVLRAVESGGPAAVRGEDLVIGPLTVRLFRAWTPADPERVAVMIKGVAQTDLFTRRELRAIRKAAERRAAAWREAEREAGRALAAEAVASSSAAPEGNGRPPRPA